MSTPIRCPKCAAEFELSDLIRDQVASEARAAADTALADRRRSADAQETELRRLAREIEEREQRLDLDVERLVAAQAETIREREAKTARERAEREADARVRDKERELTEARAGLRAATSKEADLMKRERLLAERAQRQSLDVEQRVAEEIGRVRAAQDKVVQQRLDLALSQQALRDEEHRQHEAGLQKTIDELQRRLRNGPTQAQGEAQEVVLRELLARSFPRDELRDVPKGVRGADVIQGARGPSGDVAGLVLWESKRTQSWSPGWLTKVRQDQRAAGAVAAIIVTQALPAGVQHVTMERGVWVCAWPFAVALATALRVGILEVALARRAGENQSEMMAAVHAYITGTGFRSRVEGIVDALVDLQEDLDSERRAMMTRWKRREQILERGRANMTALVGDVQGLGGRKVQPVKLLALEAGEPLHGPTPTGKLLADGGTARRGRRLPARARRSRRAKRSSKVPSGG